MLEDGVSAGLIVGVIGSDAIFIAKATEKTLNGELDLRPDNDEIVCRCNLENLGLGFFGFFDILLKP